MKVALKKVKGRRLAFLFTPETSEEAELLAKIHKGKVEGFFKSEASYTWMHVSIDHLIKSIAEPIIKQVAEGMVKEAVKEYEKEKAKLQSGQ